MVMESTCTAPVNIAVVKYWGKRSTELMLPTNSSLSVTLSQDDLRSKTTARCVEGAQGDRLWLNGEEEAIKQGGRTSNCLRELRGLRKRLEEQDGSLAKIADFGLRIASVNNFPTAAGLASSASGLAALVYTVGTLYQLDDAHGVSLGMLSRISRMGSGSACRSMFGGFVAWERGEDDVAGSDSVAVQVATREHWPEMSALICVVSDRKKGTSSTAGMQRTVATSPLLQARVRDVVPQRMARMTEAIQRRDFDSFAVETMADSNSFHAVCLDTAPPIFYMNDVSRAIVAVVEELNRASIARGEGYVAAYTFDAGPNAVLYTPQKNVELVRGLVARFFPGARDGGEPAQTLPEGFNENVVPVQADSVSRLIHTRVGDGPRVLPSSEGLLNDSHEPI